MLSAMSTLGVPDLSAGAKMADASVAVLLGEPVRIHDDLSGSGSVTMTAAGRRRRWHDGAVAVAMPTWRARGPRSVAPVVPTVHQVPDMGLLVDTGLATASVDLLRLVGADPVALLLNASVAPTAVVALSSVLQAWCERALTVLHLSQARMPTTEGLFTAHVLQDVLGRQHVMVTLGDDPGRGPRMVLAECVVGMAIRGLGCNCRAELHDALRVVRDAGEGSVMLVRAGLAELAAPGACAPWSAPDPAAQLRHQALAAAALVSVCDRQRRDLTAVHA
jgi:hypothetical protein